MRDAVLRERECSALQWPSQCLEANSRDSAQGKPPARHPVALAGRTAIMAVCRYHRLLMTRSKKRTWGGHEDVRKGRQLGKLSLHGIAAHQHCVRKEAFNERLNKEEFGGLTACSTAARNTKHALNATRHSRPVRAEQIAAHGRLHGWLPRRNACCRVMFTHPHIRLSPAVRRSECLPSSFTTLWVCTERIKNRHRHSLHIGWKLRMEQQLLHHLVGLWAEQSRKIVTNMCTG